MGRTDAMMFSRGLTSIIDRANNKNKYKRNARVSSSLISSKLREYFRRQQAEFKNKKETWKLMKSILLLYKIKYSEQDNGIQPNK